MPFTHEEYQQGFIGFFGSEGNGSELCREMILRANFSAEQKAYLFERAYYTGTESFVNIITHGFDDLMRKAVQSIFLLNVIPAESSHRVAGTIAGISYATQQFAVIANVNLEKVVIGNKGKKNYNFAELLKFCDGFAKSMIEHYLPQFPELEKEVKLHVQEITNATTSPTNGLDAIVRFVPDEWRALPKKVERAITL